MVLKKSINIGLAVILGALILLLANIGIASAATANDLNTKPPLKVKSEKSPMMFNILSTTSSTVSNPDGSFTYTQQVDETSTAPYYTPPANGGGFEIYSWYNQNYGWMHDFSAWNIPGLSIVSAQLKIRAWDVDSEVTWGTEGEYDGLSVDGTMLNPGYLQGNNNQWSETFFDIPVTNILDDGKVNCWLDIDMTHNYNNWATTLDYSLLTITYRLDGNLPPFQPLLSITPSGAVYDGDNLVVNVTGPNPADPDADAVHYEYRWFVDVGNGFFVDDTFAGRGEHTGNTVPAADTQVGDTWRVQVTPIDEHGAAGPYATTTFGIVAPQQLVWNIYSYKQLDLGIDWAYCAETGIVQLTGDDGSTTVTFEDTNGDGKQDKAFVTVNGYSKYYNTITFDVLNTGTLPIKISDVKIINNNPSELEITMLEGSSVTIKPNRRKAIGIEFHVVDGAAPGSFTFTFSL